jgi:hypothetical protein
MTIPIPEVIASIHTWAHCLEQAHALQDWDLVQDTRINLLNIAGLLAQMRGLPLKDRTPGD